MISYKRYSIYFVISMLAIGLCIGLFNYAVNPYLMFNTPKVLNLGDKKPESDTRVRMFKKYQANFSDYNTLIIGNSRVEMGINPNSPLFENRQVYNLGIPGIGVNGQLAYAEHVMETQAIEQIFISLDFLDFLSFNANAQFQAYSLDINEIEDCFASTLSIDATVSSIITLLSQSQYSPTRLQNGFNPAQDYWPIIKYEGQAVLFEQKISQVQAGLQGKIWQPSMKQREHSPLFTLIDSVKKWQAEGLKVHVFINPYHSEYYKQIEIAGHVRAFGNWRSAMRKSFEAELSVPFYDFTDLGESLSNELDENGHLVYFWEPAHYTEAMGHIMLQKMLKNSAN